ncbi:Uncharacterized membrane protein YgdD, TMEM256/DUF423 family [Verrucomicrobium sp. GAS474]|uniref:DUF423 domain-containing protein n=1 Tax=Verrucomicrobium sp. GAS474 TaxID=1882831 RepID=UPI00087C89ED|nr:DUF423 domain-containing protein [Verrucomicrobium sp. GAS474]SDT88113.1 Uncharacterized membrane protein YgdD, TMEM256/DUF423 family [Verrucomicrobium sp. GAS474]
MKSCTPSRRLAAASVLGFLGVALGAFGAHALAPALLERGMTEAWKTAVLYHLVHVAVLLALVREESVPDRVRGCFVVGIVLFSGSLYALGLGAPRGAGIVTPLGGLCFLAGWVGLFVTALRNGNKE